MAKAILICSKICSGKTIYAKQLCRNKKSVLLSVDEIMLSVFGQHAGDKHDEYTQKIKKYLLNKSTELIKAETNAVLDWGFWQKADREHIKEFYRANNIQCEFHYIDISDELWKSRIDKRNRDVLDKKTEAYYVDDNLAAKFNGLFEIPDKSEIDVWVKE